jgi:hypothetical protein
MVQTIKITKMASNNDPNNDPPATVSGSEGSIHINLDKEVITGYEEGTKVFKGTYCLLPSCQVKLVQATELEHVETLENKIEVLQTT